MFIRHLLVFATSCACVLVASVSFGQESGKSFGNPAAAKDKNVEQQLRKLTEEVVAAEVRGDLAAMDRFFTDDYVHTHSSGWVENKAEFMGLYKNGKRKYNAADISQVQVHFYDTSAVVNGHEHINELNGDHQYLFLCVWVQQQGAWRLAAWVANPVPKTAGPPDNFK
jgi:hypothetical protein